MSAFARAIFACVLLLLCGCGSRSARVVIYTAQDQMFAEPIFRAFTAETGIEVLPVFDNEAVKTVGLVNRLMAEQRRPQCDVFWNNEELRTRMLAARGMFEPDFSSFGARSRRIVVNEKLVPAAERPHSFLELTNAVWRGKVALAYPLFGTTATHFMALREKLGVMHWDKWCRALLANKPLLVDGNSVVVKLVASGEALVGMTDSDDIFNARVDGAPVAAMPLSEDGLLIPNTIGVVRNAPNRPAAEKLAAYLQSEPVVKRLIEAGAIECSTLPTNAPGLHPNWLNLRANVDPATEHMKRIFLR